MQPLRGLVPRAPPRRTRRFAEFTYKTDGEIKVQERTDSFNMRMPAMGATEGHVAAANSLRDADCPPPTTTLG